MRNILELTLKNGGYSHEKHNDGYMVSLYGTETKINIVNTNEYDITYLIEKFFNDHGTINTWIDGDDLYLDVSVNIKNLDKAIEFGKLNRQLAIYDCNNNKVITI